MSCAKKSNNKGDHWAPNFDYIVTYARDRSCCLPFLGGINVKAYDQIETEGLRAGEHYQLVRLYMSTIENQNPEQRFLIRVPRWDSRDSAWIDFSSGTP